MTTTTTTALQVVTNIESQDEQNGSTRGWIVPAGTAYADLADEAIDFVDIPASEDQAEWFQGFRDVLAAAGYAVEGEITGGTITSATVVTA